MAEADLRNFIAWFQEYDAVEGEILRTDSSVIEQVDSDELDSQFIETRIQEATQTIHIAKQFCSRCHDLFDNWPDLGESQAGEQIVAQHFSTFELESSARLGCRFCRLVLQMLKDRKLLDTFRRIESRICFLGQKGKCCLSIESNGPERDQELWLNFPGKVFNSPGLNFVSALLSASGVSYFISVDNISLTLQADCYDMPVDVLHITQNWFLNCCESHELCNSTQEHGLPTRVICIADKSPKLMLTSTCSEKIRYATLSHCWGSGEAIIKLTTKNLESFLEKIPMENFPRAFGDAFKIAQTLGIDYLWIDSLCILQDSKDDWERESARMYAVYSGSTINIAASSASDSSQGCFLKSDHLVGGGCRARVVEKGQCGVREFDVRNSYELCTTQSHLASRAWTLQERLLPLRTIYFGDRGAFWECGTIIASEYLPDGVPAKSMTSLVSRKTNFDMWMWHQAVMIYSGANLTFAKDKLPAISGVARFVHNKTGDQYLAGLWRAQLEEQLCWSRSKPGSNIKRPPWRAPSWSWAATDGAATWWTRYSGRLEITYAHVLDASTTLIGTDPFGQVTSGVVRLACSSVVAGHLIPSTPPTKLHGDAFVVLHADAEEQQFPIVLDCSDDICRDVHEPVHLVPIIGGKILRAMSESPVMIEGVVLRTTSNTKGEFSRIGFFIAYSEDSKSRFDTHGCRNDYDSFIQIISEHGSEAAEAACAEMISDSEYPDHRYVISII